MPTQSNDQAQSASFSLPPQLRAIHEAEYPHFSDAEMTRRRAAVADMLKEAGTDHLIFCGANRFGTAVQWLTGWPVTTEAVGVFTPDEADAMFVQHVNHAPLAQKIAARAKVAWGGGSSIAAAMQVLDQRRAQTGRVAVIGPMTFEQHATLSEKFGVVKNLNRPYVRLRQVKSAEEIDWMRIGAALSDRGMLALRDGLRAGATERELSDVVERGYVALGGATVIHFIGVTPMAAPRLGVPTQFAANRKVACRRSCVRRDQRRVLGLSRPGAAQLRARRRADTALPRPARYRRCGVCRNLRDAQGRHHAARSDRGRRRHRTGGLHHY